MATYIFQKWLNKEKRIFDRTPISINDVFIHFLGNEKCQRQSFF